MDEHRAGRIPRGVATRFPRRAQPARWEARRIRLALNQLRRRERLHRMLVLVERQESIVLLGGESGLGLKPVREVRHPPGNRPFLDDLRDDGRDLEVELFPEANGRDQLLVDVGGQLVAHLPRAEGVAAEVGRGRQMGSVGVRGPVRRGGGTCGTSRDLLKDSAARAGDVRGHEGGRSELGDETVRTRLRTARCVLRAACCGCCNSNNLGRHFAKSKPPFRRVDPKSVQKTHDCACTAASGQCAGATPFPNHMRMRK